MGAHPPEPPPGLVVTIAWDLGEHAGGVEPLADALEGSTFVSGAGGPVVARRFGPIERAEDPGPWPSRYPTARGVVVVPAFTGLGSPWWDQRARGTITGITRGAGRAQIARATVEAMAFQVRDMVDAVAAAGQEVAALRADGGAAAMGLLLQLQADQVGCPVARPRSLESTASGQPPWPGWPPGCGILGPTGRTLEVGRRTRPERRRLLAEAGHEAWRRALDRARHWASD